MIVVYAFYPGDEELALKNAKWINELGPYVGHEMFVLYDNRCNSETVVKVKDTFGKCFDKVHIRQVDAQIDGWPQGANNFFRLAANLLETKPNTPFFFWMEPDAIPLRSGWLDSIVTNHLMSKKLFTGDKVQVENIPVHMSGVGIYPLPLHAHAGEAYRAFEVAWDIAAKDQIVPRANFTDLIEHAWKHPTFKTQDEVKTQISPKTVLFHSSKDGSLIDFLRENRGRKMQPDAPMEPKEIVQPQNSFGSPSPSTLPAVPVSAGSVENQEGNSLGSVSQRSGGHPISCDIFIRTYPGDYLWLDYCLQSIAKFCTGFRKIWIISPQEPTDPLKLLLQGFGGQAEWKVINDESPDGYLAQQITKLYADVFTDYQPDLILHVDSDVIFTRPCTPEDFMQDGKVVWYYTPYEHTKTPWKPITETFMGEAVDYEFMRRFPIMVPKWLYPRIREFCYHRHGRIISEYVRMQPLRSFSEFNALGAFAWKFNHDYIAWENTLECNMPSPYAKQYHSWSGISDEIRKEMESFLADSPKIDNGAEEPQRVTTISKIRNHVDGLVSIWDGNRRRKEIIVRELRKVKLVPQHFK